MFDKEREAHDVLSEYQYTIRRMAAEEVEGGRLTATQYMQKYYPYTTQNRDAWLTCMDKIIFRLDAATEPISLNTKRVYQVAVEEVYENGQ